MINWCDGELQLEVMKNGEGADLYHEHDNEMLCG